MFPLAFGTEYRPLLLTERDKPDTKRGGRWATKGHMSWCIIPFPDLPHHPMLLACRHSGSPDYLHHVSHSSPFSSALVTIQAHRTVFTTFRTLCHSGSPVHSSPFRLLYCQCPFLCALWASWAFHCLNPPSLTCPPHYRHYTPKSPSPFHT